MVTKVQQTHLAGVPVEERKDMGRGKDSCVNE